MKPVGDLDGAKEGDLVGVKEGVLEGGFVGTTLG